MAPARKQVFLSYTTEFRDFPVGGRTFVQAARDAIRDCGCDWVDMGDFRADSRPSVDACTERVTSCDIWIGIVGFRYGDQPRNERSYVEAEYEAAATMDRLAFLWTTVDTHLIPYERIDQGRLNERQGAFRTRVQSEVTCAWFTTPDRLAYAVEATLRSRLRPTMPSWFEAIEIEETGDLPPEALDLARQSEFALGDLPDACRRASRVIGHLERRAELPAGIEEWPPSDQIAVARRTVLSMVPMVEQLSALLIDIETGVADSDAMVAQALVERPDLLRDSVVEIHDESSLALSRLRTLLGAVGARQSRDWAPMRTHLKDLVDRLTSAGDITATWVTAATVRPDK